MQLSNRYKILFILFVVLGVYYPVIFAGANSIDDQRMLLQLADIEQVDWKGLFLPSGGFYYRPLLMLSFIADKFLWDLTPSFMHLENVLIHAANAVLVFVLANRFFTEKELLKYELPLICALLFALHPINTEPVVWISGRTDPLACLFVLLSLLSLLKGLDNNRYSYLFLSSVLLLLGCMSKEVAVFFLPGACLMMLYWHQQQSGGQNLLQLLRDKSWQLLALLTPFFLAGSVYALLRLFSHRSNSKGILSVFEGNPHDLFNTVRVIFKVFGFYVKKLFLPLPLNFAIIQFNHNYVWLGIGTFFLLFYIAWRRTMISALFLTTFFLIIPAILVSLSHIAWTPVAERYLYLPTVFFVIGMVSCAQSGLSRINRAAWILPVFLIILLPAAYFSEQRIIIWQDNLTLYQDTFEKSPDFLLLRNELAIALIHKGKTDEARLQLETAKKLDPKKTNVLIYVNQAMSKMQQGKLLEARAVLLETFTEKKSANAEVLKVLAKIDESRLFKLKGKNPQERRDIYREIMDTHDHLYRKTKDPVSLYRGGQMALFLGETKMAGDYFAKAYQAAPDGTYFKPAAKKLAEKYNR